MSTPNNPYQAKQPNQQDSSKQNPAKQPNQSQKGVRKGSGPKHQNQDQNQNVTKNNYKY